MANTDYTLRGSGDLAPVATLTTAVTVATVRFFLDSYSMPADLPVGVDNAIMIDDEICKVTAFGADWIDVLRGCADTVPAPHAAGVPCWFFDVATGSDEVEYVLGETLSVKLLVSTSSKTMGVDQAPPNQITMTGRAAKPYPPGKVKVDGASFSGTTALSSTKTNMVLTWAHRDRVIQWDVLVGHEVDSIGPEAGTTYIIRAYTAAGVLKRTVEVDGTTFAYSVGQGVIDSAAGTGSAAGYLTLSSKRGIFESHQLYRINFTADGAGLLQGWGRSWGLAFGN